MELKELIKKRIEENVARYDLGVIESYEYLIEMIAIEYHTQQSSITAVGCRREQLCAHNWEKLDRNREQCKECEMIRGTFT